VAIAFAAIMTASSIAQIQTLSQSTNSTTPSGNSAACGPTGLTYTVDNGYFRSYPLATLGSNVEIVSITFGVQNVVAPPTGGFPMVIRLWNDPTPPTIAPYAGLQLRHTENFTLPTTPTATVVTRALSGPPVTFTPADTLVVELFSASGAYNTTRFIMGSNTLGQSAPSFIRAPACAGLAEPTDTAVIGFPNMHIILDVNVIGQVPPTFPGTGEDLFLLTGINANPLTAGIANQAKTATNPDTVTMQIVSPNGTFNFREVVLLYQPYPTGFPPFPPIAPSIHVTIPGVGFLIGGAPPPFGPAVLSPGGTTISLQVPLGFAGTTVLLQGVVITWFPPFAGNGLYASTDAHEIHLM
jgi:hypothetical protein